MSLGTPGIGDEHSCTPHIDTWHVVHKDDAHDSETGGL